MIEVHDGASGTTFSEFAGITAEAVSAKLTKQALEHAAEEDSAKMSSWLQASKGDAVKGPVAEKLVSVLQDDMGGIFASIWSDCRELKEAAEETKTSSKPRSVVLTEHEFSYEVEPEVDVLVAHVECGRFKFTVKMACTVSALAVELKKGSVTAIRAGSCAGDVEILLAGQSVWKQEILHADLPGVLKLKEPIVLA